MARPKYEAGSVEARERMLEALWTLIEEKPCDKITVADVVRSAGVNRNTFYYHFESVPDYLDKAVYRYLEFFSTFVLGRFLQQLTPDNLLIKSASLPSVAVERDEIAKAVKRVQLLAGENSSNALIGIIKADIFKRFTEIFRINTEQLDRLEVMSIRFIIAGVLEMWGCIGDYFQDDEISIDLMSQSPVVQANITTLTGIISRHEKLTS